MTVQPFHDAIERPPQGGFHYFYDPADGSTMFRKYSADEVIDEVIRYRRNNGKDFARSAIATEVWTYWCSRQPERCGGAAKSNVVPFLPRDLTPKIWGPWIWNFLNLAAVRFDHIGPERFFQILSSVSPMMTCPQCQGHWALILEANPPEFSDARGASKWVNRVHNLVNAETGAAQYPYEKMVVEYGAPLP